MRSGASHGKTTSPSQGGASAPLDMYFNSLEPGGDGSDPNLLLSDDWSRRFWFKTEFDPSLANAGWNGYWGGSVSGDPTGRNYGRAQGVGGGYCTSQGGYGPGVGAARGSADHSLHESVTELYFRYYVNPLLDYFAGQEKAITFNKGPAGVGGIYAGTVFWDGGSGNEPNPHPFFLEVNNPGGFTNRVQNQGNNYTLVKTHWNFVMVRLKFVSDGNDIVQMWMDDCGTDGRTHPSTPTLRMSHTDCTLRQAGDSTPSIGSVWLENWASPASAGEMLYDQLMVSKVPLGFAV